MLLAGLGPLGLPELAIILVIVVLIFGVGRLPEVGGAIGKGLKEFRHATKDDEHGDTTANASTDATEVMTTTTTTETVATAAPAVSASETMFCAECGARNLRAAKFCAECGKPIAAPVG